MARICESVHVLCFHVNFKHESTKNHVFSAYFYSSYIIKGLLEGFPLIMRM